MATFQAIIKEKITFDKVLSQFYDQNGNKKLKNIPESDIQIEKLKSVGYTFDENTTVG